MPMLKFDEVKYCLVYIPGDKRRGFQPFLTYPVEYTSFSRDIFENLLNNMQQKTRVSVSYDDQDFTSIIICVAKEEIHLGPVISWALQVKNLHVPIERIVHDSPRFVTESRISLPPLQHYPQISESELSTCDDESDKTQRKQLEESPAKSSSSASTTNNKGQPLSQTALPTLPDMPSTLRGGCLSLDSKSEESDQSQPTTFNVQTTSNSDDRKMSSMKHVNCSNVDNLVRKRGLQPNTVESLYFLISVVLKKQLQLEQEVKSINSGCMPDTSFSEEHFDSEPLVNGMDDFSEKLSDSDFKKSVVKRLTRHAGQNVRQTVKLVLHRMFSLKELSMMNRNGTDGKKKFIGPVEAFVKDVVSAIHSECSPEQMEKAIASTFKVSANKVRTPNTTPRKTPQNRKRRRSETV